MSMHWLDGVILSIITLSVITGLIRGFIKELIALSVWVLAIFLAYHYADIVEILLKPYIEDNTLRVGASLILILLSTLIVGALFNVLFNFIVKRSGLSGTDRLLGMGFGFFRGLVIVALIIFVVKMTSLPHQSYNQQSVLYAQFDPLVDWLSKRMPEVIKQIKSYETKHLSSDMANLEELTLDVS